MQELFSALDNTYNKAVQDSQSSVNPIKRRPGLVFRRLTVT